jgi:hypothetical protein
MPDTLADWLNLAEQAVDRIEHGANGVGEVSNLRDCLIGTLKSLKRDAGVEAAADDLYSLAALVVTQTEVLSLTPRQKRVLRDAARRFCERVTNTVPRVE